MDDFSNWSTEMPTKPPFPWKLVLLGVTLVLVLGIVGVMVWRLRTPVPSLLLQQTIATQTQQATDACASSADPEACRSTAQNQIAQATGEVQACTGLAPAAADDCVWGVASAKRDPSICKEIKDAVFAVECSDGILRQQAISTRNEKLCTRLSSKDLQDACMESVTPTTSVNCATRGKSQDECAFLTLLASMTPLSKETSCDSLKDETQKGYCLERLTAAILTDSDGDGLTDADEVNIYHTNPNNPDTDGDGYSDGVEVQGGFNPNGPGKLAK